MLWIFSWAHLLPSENTMRDHQIDNDGHYCWSWCEACKTDVWTCPNCNTTHGVGQYHSLSDCENAIDDQEKENIMSEFNNYVCSNCGERCYYDGRCGDGPVLYCKCAAPENSYWVSEGSRGGYTEHLNGAHPIPAHEYGVRRNSHPVQTALNKEDDRWDREDD